MNAFVKSLILGTAIAVSTMNASAHPSEFLVTAGPQGIVVDKVTRHGIEPVHGSPFVPSPVPGTVSPLCMEEAALQPSFLSLDPDGKYLYALYAADGCLYMYSFQMLDGVPYVISPLGYFMGAHNHSGAFASGLVVSKHFVFILVQANAVINHPALVVMFEPKNGVLIGGPGLDLGAQGFMDSPSLTSLQVDETERYVYVTYQGTLGTTGSCPTLSCIAIFHSDEHSGVFFLVATVPAVGSFQTTTH